MDVFAECVVNEWTQCSMSKTIFSRCTIIILHTSCAQYTEKHKLVFKAEGDMTTCKHKTNMSHYYYCLNVEASPGSLCVFCRDTVSHHLPCHSMPPCNQDHGIDIQTLSVCVWSRYSQPTQPPECVVGEK